MKLPKRKESFQPGGAKGMSRLFKKKEGTVTQEEILGASSPARQISEDRCCQKLSFTERALITPEEEPCRVAAGKGVGAKVKQELEQPFPASP